MLFTLFGILSMFYFYGQLESYQLLSIGALLVLGIFGYTSLMDRNNWAGIFEILRAGLGITLVFLFPETLGFPIFSESVLSILTAYYVLTLTFTFYFAFLDKEFSLSTI